MSAAAAAGKHSPESEVAVNKGEEGGFRERKAASSFTLGNIA